MSHNYLKNILDERGLVDLESKLKGYISILKKWNEVYRLIGSMDNVGRHLEDSISLKSVIWGDRVLDVGSGNGFPGVVLSMMCPEKKFTLLDSSHKKIGFLRQVVYECNLDNVEVVWGRCEEYNSDDKFDVITCLALGSLDYFWRSASHLLAGNGEMVAMKGRYPEYEIEEISQNKTIVISNITEKIEMIGDWSNTVISLKKA